MTQPDLVIWLLSRIDTAHEAVDQLPWPAPTSDPVVHAQRQRYAEYIERRRSTEANKRSVVEEHLHVEVSDGFGCQTCAFDSESDKVKAEGWCTTIRAVALIHAGETGYREEWKPDE